ncbi:MAG: family protein phosphatase [Frankiaceae bacterium]|nr:family protein phosphatase [Frankiaceae bacterium]
MTLSLKYGARSDVGLLRDGNEDAMYAGPRLLAVADGMGGHAAGEVASRVVIETVAALDGEPPADDLTGALRAAVETANNYLRDMVAADSALEGMGTTLTALLWVRQQLGLVHIGDSRAYLLRDGQLQQVTHDHTLVQSLIDEGRISPEEATTHPQRSWITNALDGRAAVEPDLSVRDVRAADRYLICSDGLSSYVTEQTIAEALATPDPQQACDRLVELALRAGGPDNVTCIVADLVEDDVPAGQPIVGGAAAENSSPTSQAADSPASRAAAVQRRTDTTPLDDKPTEPDGSADEPAHERGPGSGSRRIVAVLVGVVLLVVLGALGTFLYIRTQYYVGVSAGPPPQVAVYRGVSGSVLGLDLFRLSEHTDLPVSALPDFEQAKVSDTIPASSQSDAERIVQSLREQACTAATPSPTTTPSPRRPSARPAPTPTPTYCADAP